MQVTFEWIAPADGAYTVMIELSYSGAPVSLAVMDGHCLGEELETLACESDADCCYPTRTTDGERIGWCAGATHWRCVSSRCRLSCEC